MTLKQLRQIYNINSFPLLKSDRKKLLTKIPENILLRLEKRVKIHSAIKKAEESGIYKETEKQLEDVLKKLNDDE